MATTTTTTQSLNFTLNLVRGGDTTKRTVGFDYTGSLSEAQINAAGQSWLSLYPNLFQPTNWRDSDSTEEEWTTIGITPAAKTTTTVTYEPQSANGNNDTQSGGEG